MALPSKRSEQTVQPIHYMVADGHPNSEVDAWNVRHIVFPKNVGSYGATPRGIGAITAFADGADAVYFLDVDNWIETDHVAQIADLMKGDPEFIFVMRRILFPDGDELYRGMGNQVIDDRIHDTNCIALTKKASYLAPVWSMYPRQLGAGEETPFFQIVREMMLKVSIGTKPTVCYLTNWQHHYRRAGKKSLVKLRSPDQLIQDNWNTELYRQATGIALSRLHYRAGPGPKPVDAKNARVTIVTSTDSGDVTETWCRAVEELDCKPMHIIVGRTTASVETDGERRLWLDLPFPLSRPPAFDESIGAILGFQYGTDIVLFLRAGGEVDGAKIARLLSSAAALKANTKQFMVAAGNERLQDIATDQALDMAAVPRTIAGRFLQRNLARGVPGFTGRGWKRVLDT